MKVIFHKNAAIDTGLRLLLTLIFCVPVVWFSWDTLTETTFSDVVTGIIIILVVLLYLSIAYLFFSSLAAWLT